MHIDLTSTAIYIFFARFLSAFPPIKLHYSAGSVKRRNNPTNVLLPLSSNLPSWNISRTQILWIFRGWSKFQRHHSFVPFYTHYTTCHRLKARLTVTLILYLNAYLLHEYRFNIDCERQSQNLSISRKWP